MKYILCNYLLTLFIVFLISNANFGQDNTSTFNLSVMGIVSLPQGNFGNHVRTPGPRIISPSQASFDFDKSGYANNGYGGSIEGSVNIFNNIKLVSTFSYIHNGFEKSAYKYPINITSIYVASADNYVSMWLLTGIGYEIKIAPNVRIYGMGQLGALRANLPEVVFSDRFHNSDNYNTVVQSSDERTALAASFGAGVIIYNIIVGIRFYMGEVEYERTTTFSWHDNRISETTQKPKNMLLLIVGLTI